MPVRSPVDYLDTDPESYIGDDDADVAAQEQLAQQRRAAQMPAASVPIAPMPPQAGPDTSALQAAIQRRTQLEQNAPLPPKPKWWQRLAAAGAGAAIGASNVRGHAGYIDPTAPEQAILAPGYARQQMEYQRQLQGAKAAEQGELEKLSIPAQIEKEAATTAELKGRGKYYEQQAKTMEEEGKRAPKGNYIAVKDAIFDATTGQWLNGKAPSAVSLDVMEISPEKGRALGLQPNAEGKYVIPKEGIGAYFSSQKQTQEKDVNAVKLAILAAGGDPENPKTLTPQIAQKASAILKPNASSSVSLSPEAIDYWAKYAGTTGLLPSLGMGNAGAPARTQILNRTPQLMGGSDVAANKATYHADSLSLGALQKMRDAVVSFEATASKNLDVFENQAKKVIDSGSPIINQPLRSINRNVLGGVELAAYDAARRVAINEVAKVTSNPTLAGQLSDSARREVEEFIPERATLGQIYRVVRVLRQDMRNRKDSLDQGITEIKGRIAGRSAAAPAGGGTVVWTRDAQGNPVPQGQ